ncbi:MAG: hypothetical protein NVS1B2_09920 [Vulcanimicrobiaceae bacterium]
MKISLASCALALTLCGTPVAAAEPVSVDDAGAAAVTGGLSPVDVVPDERLATMRGKYVPTGNDAGALAGSIVYFGLDMATTWTTGGPTATTYAANMRVAVDLSDAHAPKLDIVRGSSQQDVVGTGSGAPQGPIGPGTIDGNVGGASGFVQSIQIAGSGNAVANGASLTIGTVAPSLIIASPNGTSTACSACSFDTTPGRLGVSIALPNGNLASQTLGANGIAQNASVTTNANTVANQLHLALGVRPGADASFAPAIAAGLFAPLPTTGLH